uniref:WGS project CAEQ00000000 data, annotated contig 431 n=1 Tax=Trypanosoma congolense (strain IL3000) TaxID=1068625 RepID=F9WFX1_TRYCI|nr:unnamed protein product [Trypanosoma congolense IL3000]
MHQPIGWGSGRSTVALSLSRGVVGTPEGGHMDAGVGARYCSVSVLPSDPASSSVRGLGMVRRCSNTNQHELSPIGSSLNVLAVRTPFITVEGSESGDTLPYTRYIKSLGDHIATALLSCDGAELITVAHGPTGSGKSTQLFGSSLSPAADTGGIFSDVLQRIFATSRYEAGFSPCVAISVVEWRSMYSPSGSSKANVFASHSNRIIEDSFDGHCSCLFDEGVAHAMEARDLLSRTRDRSSPTGCFMEDYADIPAARYVSCTSTREVLEVLHEAFRYSHAWRVVGGVPDDAVLAVQTPNESLPGSHAPASSSAVLCPVTGSSTHVLVTLLIRRVDRAGGRSAWGIWRLWDLCGPAGAPDDVSSAAASTHTSLCHMAKCIVRSGERFSGTWLAVTGTTKLLPGFISDMIPLISTASLSESARGDRGEKSLSGTGVEKVTAMIEAVMQHSCSSVVWIGSLRRDPSFDTVNEGVLEAAAAIAAYGGIADTTALTELRRQRRAENLRAAERVMDIFTIPFESFHEQPAVGKQRAPRGADHIGDDLSTPNGKTTRVGNVASVRRKFRLVSPTPTVEAPTSLSQLSDPSPSRSLPLPSSSQASVDKSSGDDFAHRGSHPDGWDSCGHCPVVDAPTEDIADTGLPGSVVGVDVRTDCVDISCVSAAEASSFVPQRELETVAHVLQHLLGPPLAQLRLTSEHHREQLQQQQRVIAQLNELLYSSGLILGEMRVQEQRQEKLLNAIERNNLLERRLQKLEHENNRLRAQLKLSHENSGVACTGKCATGHRAASASASGHTVGAGLGVLLSEKHHERTMGHFLWDEWWGGREGLYRNSF